jgi:hypothetical protein
MFNLFLPKKSTPRLFLRSCHFSVTCHTPFFLYSFHPITHLLPLLHFPFLCPKSCDILVSIPYDTTPFPSSLLSLTQYCTNLFLFSPALRPKALLPLILSLSPFSLEVNPLFALALVAPSRSLPRRSLAPLHAIRGSRTLESSTKLVDGHTCLLLPLPRAPRSSSLTM